MSLSPDISFPSIADVQKARESLGDSILTTPVWRCRTPELQEMFGPDFSLWFKLELWQYGGSFKVRAALLGILALPENQRQRGVIAISAGNHAIAVAYAAKQCGIPAKVFMPKTASPVRIEKCQLLGAEVQLMESMQELFEKKDEIKKSEEKPMIHPFNGENVALGTGTLGLEFHQQVKDMDVVLMGVGGGGLIGGVGNVLKQLNSKLQVIGIEPENASVLYRSFAMGRPVEYPNPQTIADSLAVPKAEDYAYALCRRSVDQMVLVSETAIVDAMRFLFRELKLAIEPAAAVGLAGLLGPLRNQLAGKCVGIILSGSNIDERKYCNLIS